MDEISEGKNEITVRKKSVLKNKENLLILTN